MLIAFCGLPGAGKTTLARRLAQQRQATYLRIDAIEEACWPTAEPALSIVARAIARRTPLRRRT
jgi:predicted kinase